VNSPSSPTPNKIVVKEKAFDSVAKISVRVFLIITGEILLELSSPEDSLYFHIRPDYTISISGVPL